MFVLQKPLEAGNESSSLSNILLFWNIYTFYNYIYKYISHVLFSTIVE